MPPVRRVDVFAYRVRLTWPCSSRRLVEQSSDQLPFCESQQERARQPQHQHRFSCCVGESRALSDRNAGRHDARQRVPRVRTGSRPFPTACGEGKCITGPAGPCRNCPGRHCTKRRGSASRPCHVTNRRCAASARRRQIGTTSSSPAWRSNVQRPPLTVQAYALRGTYVARCLGGRDGFRH